MKFDVLGFGIVKEIFQDDCVNIEGPPQMSLGQLKLLMEEKYPALKRLGSYMVAVNKEYARDDQLKILTADEIAIIPPVSGG